nr:hypothetical protein [Nonomuraea sp. FMUSA5-5]
MMVLLWIAHSSPMSRRRRDIFSVLMTYQWGFDQLVTELEPWRRTVAEAEREKRKGNNGRGCNPGFGFLDHRHRVLATVLSHRNTVTLTLAARLLGRDRNTLSCYAHRTRPLLGFADDHKMRRHRLPRLGTARPLRRHHLGPDHTSPREGTARNSHHKHRCWDGKTWIGIRLMPTTLGELKVGDELHPCRPTRQGSGRPVAGCHSPSRSREDGEPTQLQIQRHEYA